MYPSGGTFLSLHVALLAEGVGRNWMETPFFPMTCVALLAEGVGRNRMKSPLSASVSVALLAEGVGRNRDFGQDMRDITKSPSSRRAWVEIS